ncbi:MAG TPA: hypothetical protein VMG60_09970 [Burkholderiaceae bacterium]|nr:hypothetical protein [Burkholderiaceae bacterium]
MRHLVLATAVALATLGTSALAQDKTTTSEPGKVMSIRTLTLTADVVAIDPTYRIVTLKGGNGQIVEVVAGDDVKNFDQIKIGDKLVAKYQLGISAEVTKLAGPRERVEQTTATRDTGSASRAHTVTILADVIATDPPKRTMTLRGPNQTVTINVENPMHFNVVNKGDRVLVTYSEAVALSLEPASMAKK